MHVGATEIADSGVGVGECAGLAKASLVARQLAKERDVVQHARRVLADAAAHVGFGQHRQQRNAQLP
ncbi:hypothetical protein D3C72_1753600 [compost metagenome]